MNVLIADDHFLFLDGLETLLSTMPFITGVRKALTEQEVYVALNDAPYDMALLDINLGKADGREVIGKIKKQCPELKVIALTSFSDTSTIKSAITAGFDGYLLKSDDRAEIEQALKTVSKGQKYFSSNTRHAVFENEITGSNHSLSARELEILQLIVHEKTNKEIAATLFISEKTVENHRTNIMLKMDVKNIAGLVRKAILTGLVIS